MFGGHAGRGARDALLAADPALAVCGCHRSGSCPGTRRNRRRSAAAASGGTPTACSAALVVIGLIQRCPPCMLPAPPGGSGVSQASLVRSASHRRRACRAAVACGLLLFGLVM